MQAILSDLDGTLVDSLEDIARALDAALADHGLALPRRDEVRSWIGGGARNLVTRAVDTSQVDSVLARFRVHYGASPVLHTQLYPGLAAVLDRFVAAGVRLAVLTNKPQELTRAICDRLLARWP